ncbi:LysR family transcriptional regulator [Paludibacterium paludis]|uniref:LysR family transcriptional regulator n=1 Tax=Paludibacterium paludis TaxID=1225769 RepID=A0A918UBX7_9NEIS|nr:LysR family transcriptional regulator [Paludibacterium paludis]GGY25892.1 LysR family transcriptional regulator [Paludibacterium paludis]
MNLRQIQFAVAVAEEENFTRAADRCHIVQSALSHQIAKLEESLGVRLFERTSRRVRLTADGKTFLPLARQLLADERRLREEMDASRGLVRGTLAIGIISAPGQLPVVDALARFHARYPQVNIRLYVGMSEALVDDVGEGRADVALIGVRPEEPAPRLPHRLVQEEHLVALLPPGHSLAGADTLRLSDIAGQTLVDFYAGSGARRQTDQAFSAKGIPRHVSFEISHNSLLEQIVRAGLAIGLVPESLAASIRDLVTRPIEDAPARRVYCVHAEAPTPAADAFLAMLFAPPDHDNPARSPDNRQS